MTLTDDLRRLGFRPEHIATATVNGKPLSEVEPKKRSEVRPQATWDGNTLRIVVPGVPVGKTRMTRPDKWKKRPNVTRYRDWCDTVRGVVGKVPDPREVVALNWTAYFEPPASWSKKRRAAAIGELHRNKPDRDNIDKAVLDCLFAQDSAIAHGTLNKLWDWNARLEVEIVTQ
jgi:Holliday junction resolvase RusA-like endonuclease